MSMEADNDQFFVNPQSFNNSFPGKLQEIIRNTPLRAHRDAYLQMSRGVRVR